MNEAISRIHRLRSEGRLSAPEAAELLAALGHREQSIADGASPAGMAYGGQDDVPRGQHRNQPDDNVSGHGHADHRQTDPAQPDHAARDQDQQDPAQQRDAQQDSAQQDQAQQDQDQQDPAQQDNTRQDHARDDRGRDDRGRRNYSRREQHRHGAGHGAQQAAGEAWWGLGEDLCETFRAAFKVGAEAWRESWRGTAANGPDVAAASGEFTARGRGRSKEWSTRWLNDSNRVVMSSVVVPEGDQFRCENNEISVSGITDLLFNVAEFNGNRLRAASLNALTLEDGIFRNQQVNGSSLRRIHLQRGMLRDNQFNGSGVARLTLRNGQLSDSVCNGAHLRGMEIVDSALSGLRITGGHLRDTAVLAGSRVDDLRIKAATLHGLCCDASVINDLSFSFIKVRGLVVRDSRLAQVRLHNVVRNGERNRPGSAAVRDLQVLNSKLRDVDFVDCNFDGACIRDCDVQGLTFEGVDFGSHMIVGNRMLEAFATAPTRRHG